MSYARIAAVKRWNGARQLSTRFHRKRTREELTIAYSKMRFEIWCYWNPEESDLEEIAQNISPGEAICTKRVVIAVANRPQDIGDDKAMSFLADKRAALIRARGRRVQQCGL